MLGLLALFLVASSTARAQAISNTSAKVTPSLVQNAINPTKPGQIGVNPVSIPNIPESEIVAAPTGDDTKLVTVIGGSTSWIGPNPTNAPVTATTTITIGGKVTAVSYVPIDATFEIASDGTVIVELGEWIREELQGIASKVVSCSLARLRARASCGFPSFAELVQNSGELFLRLQGAITPELRAAAKTALLSNTEMVQVLTALGIFTGAGLTEFLYYTWPSQSSAVGSAGNGGKIPPILKIKPKPQSGGSGKTDPNQESSTCPTEVKDFYACESSDCKGVSTCTVSGNKKGCGCVTQVGIQESPWDFNAFNSLQDAMANASSASPVCDQVNYSMDSTFWKGLGTTFCAGGLGTTKSAVLKSTDSKAPGNWDGYKDWKFGFEWNPLGSACQTPDCESGISSLASVCAYDSHTMATTGSLRGNCASIKYNLTNPNPPPPPTPQPPRALGGTCTLHLNQWQNCDSVSHDLFADIIVKDNINTVVGQFADAKNLSRYSINADNPWKVQTLFKDPIVIVGEHVGDYVRFTMGQNSWTTNDTDQRKQTWCSPGGWDPKSGPNCNVIGAKFPGPWAKRQIDCQFKC